MPRLDVVVIGLHVRRYIASVTDGIASCHPSSGIVASSQILLYVHCIDNVIYLSIAPGAVDDFVSHGRLVDVGNTVVIAVSGIDDSYYVVICNIAECVGLGIVSAIKNSRVTIHRHAFQRIAFSRRKSNSGIVVVIGYGEAASGCSAVRTAEAEVTAIRRRAVGNGHRNGRGYAGKSVGIHCVVYNRRTCCGYVIPPAAAGEPYICHHILGNGVTKDWGRISILPGVGGLIKLLHIEGGSLVRVPAITPRAVDDLVGHGRFILVWDVIAVRINLVDSDDGLRRAGIFSTQGGRVIVDVVEDVFGAAIFNDERDISSSIAADVKAIFTVDGAGFSLIGLYLSTGRILILNNNSAGRIVLCSSEDYRCALIGDDSIHINGSRSCQVIFRFVVEPTVNSFSGIGFGQNRQGNLGAVLLGRLPLKPNRAVVCTRPLCACCLNVFLSEILVGIIVRRFGQLGSILMILHAVDGAEVDYHIRVFVAAASGDVVNLPAAFFVIHDTLRAFAAIIRSVLNALDHICIAINANIKVNTIVSAGGSVIIEIVRDGTIVNVYKAEKLIVAVVCIPVYRDEVQRIIINFAGVSGLLHAVYIHLYGDVGAVIGDVTDGYGRASTEQDAAAAVPQARLVPACDSVGGIYTALNRLADARRFIHLDGEGYDELVAMPAAVIVDNNIRCIRVVKASDADVIAVHGDGDAARRSAASTPFRRRRIIPCRANDLNRHIAGISRTDIVAKVKILRQRIRECGRCVNSSAGDFAADGLKDILQPFCITGSKIVIATGTVSKANAETIS